MIWNFFGEWYPLCLVCFEQFNAEDVFPLQMSNIKNTRFHDRSLQPILILWIPTISKRKHFLRLNFSGHVNLFFKKMSKFSGSWKTSLVTFISRFSQSWVFMHTVELSHLRISSNFAWSSWNFHHRYFEAFSRRGITHFDFWLFHSDLYGLENQTYCSRKYLTYFLIENKESEIFAKA